MKARLQAIEIEVAEEAAAARSAYESRLINDFANSNQSKVFSYIRSLTKSDPIPVSVFYNDSCVSNDKQKAMLFNNYFYSVFTPTTCDQPLPNKSIDINTNQHLISINVSEEDTINALISLDPQKAVGIDGIGPKFLKNCASFLYRLLHQLLPLTL